MLKKLKIYAVVASLICTMAACNDNDSDIEVSADYSSTLVTAFSLRNDSKVLNNLDSVFFSIDLVEGRIFNADSMPYGTKIDRLMVNITTDICSAVELHYPRPGKADSIVDYLNHQYDSIDFSHGDVKLHIVSYDKVAVRDYYVRVNVHKTVADSLTWDLANPASLPSSLAQIKQQRTVQFNNNIYCFTTDGTANACVNVAATPADPGTSTSFTFPFTPNVNSITATSTAMYILAENGDLYSSVNGTEWNSCGATWKAITAPYGMTLLGIAEIDGTLTHVTYPTGSSSTVSKAFPISGNSAAIYYTTQWSTKAQTITIGGLKADGTPTSSAWAYDGTDWACIAEETPMEAQGISIFPYYCCKTDTNSWLASTRSVIVAMGGKKLDNTIQSTVYISYDLGFNWTKAPVTMQLPKALPNLYDSQVIVTEELQNSRAIRPITEWDTPFIYMYGGYTATDELMPKVYRGVINRLQFKPLQ